MKWIFAVSLIFASSVQADEPIFPKAHWQALGYQEWKPVQIQQNPQLAAHALAWPVQFQDAAHTVANSMAQFQPFGDPYFHGGCDLRVRAGADVLAPVSGKLEAGHYGYVRNPDGSLTKEWAPWPQEGNETYFEVAVVAADGVRYEFHHMDRETLPAPIVAMLNAGGGEVPVGTLLGQVITWPAGDYHHTHYNVILPDGTRVNPEFVSTMITDTLAPTILASYAVMPNDSVLDFSRGQFRVAPKEIILSVIDKKEGNVYEQPPTFVSLKFASGEESTWDFREKLLGPNGRFPNIWEFFRESLITPNGRRIYTEGGYGLGKSLIRLRVPNAKGPFTIQVADGAGNTSSLSGIIQ